jgi:GTP-binding protein
LRRANFLKSATQRSEYPEIGLPQIAFVGRSNVGKSSLINSLVGRKNLARTSSTPGRTQIINFFEVDGTWVLVDLPGYGFAKVPKDIRDRWGPMIEEFLVGDDRLRLVVVILDSRHEPTKLDRNMIEWLSHFGVPFQLIATKFDKVAKSQRTRSLRRIRESLESEDVLPFSAVTGEGKKDLWKIINGIC